MGEMKRRLGSAKCDRDPPVDDEMIRVEKLSVKQKNVIGKAFRKIYIYYIFFR
jgi:hypothetical protein